MDFDLSFDLVPFTTDGFDTGMPLSGAAPSSPSLGGALGANAGHVGGGGISFSPAPNANPLPSYVSPSLRSLGGGPSSYLGGAAPPLSPSHTAVPELPTSMDMFDGEALDPTHFMGKIALQKAQAAERKAAIAVLERAIAEKRQRLQSQSAVASKHTASLMDLQARQGMLHAQMRQVSAIRGQLDSAYELLTRKMGGIDAEDEKRAKARADAAAKWEASPRVVCPSGSIIGGGGAPPSVDAMAHHIAASCPRVMAKVPSVADLELLAGEQRQGDAGASLAESPSPSSSKAVEGIISALVAVANAQKESPEAAVMPCLPKRLVDDLSGSSHEGSTDKASPPSARLSMPIMEALGALEGYEASYAALILKERSGRREGGSVSNPFPLLVHVSPRIDALVRLALTQLASVA